VSAGRRGGLGAGQIAVLAVVGILVVGLFGWMVTNTGPSDEQKARIEASKKATEPDEHAGGVLGGGLGADGIDGGAGPTAPGGDAPVSTTPATTAPPTSGPDPFVPADRAAFCDGAASVLAFELRFSAAMVEQDRDALVEVLDTETGSWETAVDEMRGGAPPDNHNDIDDYRDGYRELFGIVRSTPTLAEAFVTMGESRLSETVMAGQRLTDQIEFACR
jgi:hypothetical protein